MNWRASEEYTHSDSQAIHYGIEEKLSVETTQAEVEAPNMAAVKLTEALASACDATMPSKLEPSNQRHSA